MINGRIVVITDCYDVAYNEIRATIINELKNSEIGDLVYIEPVVRVENFSLINASFILRLLAESYSEGTTFLVIVNPLKERPARVFGKTKIKNFHFIGANTGIFDWFLNDFGVDSLYELNDPGFLPFGGKYVHAPAAAKISTGANFNDLGKEFPIEKLKKLSFEDGVVVHVDNFGLIKFVYSKKDFLENEEFLIKIGSVSIEAVFSQRMMSKDTGQWVVYPSSSLDLMELGKVRCDGARELGIKIGDKINIIKKPV
ncbi:MAG: SAM-dependent chlorinase/fluorinase [Candidatus Pacebacteria bacterium]|nr:SAM-dependent chlorinase/fluorinase [Candidatus Paceibacterota bacterium]